MFDFDVTISVNKAGDIITHATCWHSDFVFGPNGYIQITTARELAVIYSELTK